MAGHAMRLAQGVDGIPGLEGDGFAHELVGGAPVEFQIARKRRHIGACLPERLAHVLRLDQGKVVDPLKHDTRHAHEDPAPVGCGHPSPFACACLARGCNGRVDIGCAAGGNLADLPAKRGILDRQTVPQAAPVAVDQDFGWVEP